MVRTRVQQGCLGVVIDPGDVAGSDLHLVPGPTGRSQEGGKERWEAEKPQAEKTKNLLKTD